MKNVKHLFLLVTFFCAGMLHAQTTDLLYHLGSSASSIDVASVATDPSGNIFICGSFAGSNVEFNPLGTSTLKTSAGTRSGFIASYDANGILKKAVTFGSSLVNKGIKVYVDPAAKNIYLLAAASGSVNFNGGGFGSVAAGSGAMALVKYDKNLTLKTAKIFYNGTGNAGDILNDLAFYGPDLYVTGTLFSANVEFNPGGTSKTLSPSPAGISDIVVAKYDTTTLTLANNNWAYNFGAALSDGGNGIDLDNAGNIYLTGYFTGQNTDIDPVGSVSVSEAGGGTSTAGDAFVAKYNSLMACQWAFNIGAVQIDRGNDILVNRSTGNVYVGGIVKNDALDVYFDPATTASANFSGVGLNDIFVASYTSAGTYNWHLATGSTGEDELTSLAFDLGGNVLLSGFASGNVDFGNSKTITGLGGRDAYFAIISGTSGLATATYNLGGSSDEQANAVTVNATGKILVVGAYSGTGDYDLGASNTLGIFGTQDGFVSRHVLCSPPSITTQPSSTIKCEGAAASFTVGATGATSYQWKKGTTAIPGATSATYSIAAVTVAQAGNYTVEVTNTCQTATSSNVTLTVNPKPTITSATTSSVCSGNSVGYSITADVASSYSWTRSVVAGITPAAGSGSTSPITEVLTNSNLSPTNVDYIITPTATTGSCLGSPFTLTVTVNPKPTITSAATASVCSGAALNYAIASNVASSYSWTRANKAGITPSTGSGSTGIIAEALTNSTLSPINVDYIITPTATTGGCVGNPFTLTVTVNPSVVPSVGATSSAASICAGSSITLTANPTNGGTPTYKWKLGSGYISGATNSTYITTAAANGDVYSVEMTSTAPCASPSVITSAGVTITVNPSVTPTVSATSSATTICAGVGITLTANSTNGGTPTYKWKLGSGYISGATNSTYVTTGAANGDVYSVEMVSTASCASPATVTSTGVTITVTPSVTPSVTATSSASTICANTSITLTANLVNGGGTPVYKWKLGSAYITGATNATYITAGASNGDVYSVEMTSTATCASPATVTSTGVTITVSSSVTPTATASSSATTICAGTSILLTASSTNGGGAPGYKWKLGNATIPGATNATYTTSSAANGDVYSVEITSSLACASPSKVTSSGVTITVTSTVTPTVTATSSATTICSGTSITLTANHTNGGTPTYKWKLGSTYISGATNSTYTTTGAANGDTYSVEITSSLACASPATVTSTGVSISVTPSATPTVSITSSATTICSGTSITLTANQTNGGTPTYKWKLGTAYISGATASTYTTTTATNGANYSVEMTSTATCVSPATVTSTGVSITVTPSVTPTVTASSSSTSICTGASITLTAAATNSGTPTYKWKLGSTYISNATNSTYITTTAANGDVYSVEMTSTAACASPATVTSTGVTITVGSTVVPTVSASSSATTICAGTSITLTASSTNGGTPSYKWKLGTVYITGATNATYTTSNAANNDSYTVEMTSSSGCASPGTVTSGAVVITVNPVLVPVVTIATPSSTSCLGDVITFTSTAINPGSSPSYVWRKNGVAITPAATGTSYSTTSASNNDVYSVVMTSNALCASPVSDVSNTIAVTVNPSPAITGLTTVCTGSAITLAGSGTPDASNPWGSSAPSIATVTNLGVVTGLSAGTSIITYKNSSGCTETVTVTVNATPTVTGVLPVCINSTVTLTGSGTQHATTPWVSATPSVATINNAGIVTGVAVGTSAITYTTDAGCSKTVTITVNALPTLTGASTLCPGSTTQLIGSATSHPTNAWLSATPGIATVNNSGVVTGVSAGTSLITYTNSNGCQISQTVMVNSVLTPSVSITSNNATICAGASVTFTATPTNGGTAMYQWKKNNVTIGSATNATYTTTSAVNGDSYSVDMTSNAVCVSPSNATSNAIVISVATSVVPTVTIAASPGNSVCAGDLVTFTATVGNGGSAPTYQWKKGGTAISGATNVTYNSTTLLNGDKISLDIVSNSTCASTTNVSSAEITMVITPPATATVSITAPTTTVCANTGVTFTATYTNGGSSPMFEWFVNSVSQGAPGSADTYTSSTLLNGNQVTVKLTSSLACVTNPIQPSNTITMNVTPNVTPAVSITSDKTKICAGNSVTYTATPVNGGTASYQWKIDGTNSGSVTPSNTFATSGLEDGDVVTAVLTSSVTCVTSSTATSNELAIIVAPATTIVSNPVDQSVCAFGNSVTFSVGATGDNLAYQWKAGITSLANNATYSGVTTKDLSISNVSNADLLGYKVTITGTCGTLTSSVANLTQSAGSINISAQPVAQVLEPGEMIQLSVSATGPTLSYQWKKNGIDLVNDSRISGANTSSLQISNALVSDSDNNYTCLIQSPCATQISTNATSVSVTTATSTQDALTRGFMIAPNPSAGHFTVSNNYAPFKVEEIEIVSMEGIVVVSKTIAGTTSLNEEVFAQELPKGMYLLVIKGEGEQAILKIVFDK